jgi:glycerophosphoryl diester phosphodiesterase
MSASSSNALLCFAHRGASGHEPENTLRSFSKAIDLGASWIEFDVRAVENEAIVFHDRTLTRCAKRFGFIDRQSLATVRSYDVGKGERIPLFSEVLALIKEKAKAQVELKGYGSGLVAAKVIRDALTQGWQANDFLVSAFDQSELSVFKRELPYIPLGLLVHGYPLNIEAMIQTFEPVSIHLHIDSVTPQRIADAHAGDLDVYVYTANEIHDIETLRDMGIDGLFTNYPERVLGLTRKNARVPAIVTLDEQGET